MRVSIVGPAHPLRGGIANHVYLVRNELVGRGHDVQVVSFKRLYPKILFPGKTTLDTSQLAFKIETQALLTPLGLPACVRAFLAIRRFSPDAVLLQWWNPFFGPVIGTIARLCRLAGINCIAECHNIFGHEPTILDLPLTDFALSPLRRFITHSNRDRSDLLSILPGSQVRVSTLAAPDEFIAAPTPRDGHTILFFGLVRKYKGLDVLLRAFARVFQESDYRLIVAGEFYDDEADYTKMIKELGVESRVEVLNRYVPNEEVSGLFGRADVLVLPYLTATQSAVAQVALANSLPVIASAVGGLTEVIKPGLNGLLVPPGDDVALAYALEDYFEEGRGPVLAKAIMNNRQLLNAGLSTAQTIEKFIEDV